MGKRKWTKEKIIAAIRHLHARGVDLSPAGMRKTHAALFSSARSRWHFGSWRAAIEAAGLDYSKIKHGENVWSREAILREIRQAHERGEDLLSADFKDRHARLYSAACARRYFGSWPAAVKAAGLDYEALRADHFWSRQRIIRTIRALHQAGQPLNWSYIHEKNPSLYRAARRRETFGSWRSALKAAGVVIERSPRKRRRRRSAETAPESRDEG